MVLSCGCTPDKSGYGYCDKCTTALRAKLWRQMSPEKKAYDRHFDPRGSAEMDDITYRGCSCHINPPCGYCTEKEEDDE